MALEYTVVARWESRGGKHWAELHHDGVAAFYRGNGCGGNMGLISREAAIEQMQRKVDSGYFLPDNAKTPMKLVTPREPFTAGANYRAFLGEE